MENRFLETPSIRQVNRFAASDALVVRGQSVGPRHAGAVGGESRFLWARPFSAANRALVILIENGGVDLGIPELVKKLLGLIPGGDDVPETVKERLVEYLRNKIRELTDRLVETAELSLNRYEAAKPDLFGDVVVLRDSTASYEALKSQLADLSRGGRVIDVLILTHGSDDFISVQGGITGRRLRDMRSAFGKALSIRSVYMMNCVGSTLNQAWLDAGAKVSAGTLRNNYLPEPTTYFFWQAWRAGRPFEAAVSESYKKTIDVLDAAVRSFLEQLPIPLNLLANLVNFAGMDFVKDSAPVIQGDGSLTIASDDLVFTQSLARASSVATTALPLGALRTLAMQSGAKAARTPGIVSAQGLDLIRRWSSFQTRPADAYGQCVIGFGTALHPGRCDGSGDEPRYRDGIDEASAEQLMRVKAGECQDVVNEAVRVDLAQAQNDAMVSFVYSVGGDRFRDSSLLRLLNEGNYAAVPVEIRKWTKRRDGNDLVDIPELVQRRDAEAKLFEAPVAAAQSMSRLATAQSSEIPLDPGSGGRSIGADALANGDIIVTTSPGPVSGLIRFATDAPVSHAVLYIGSGQVVEAVGEGVVLRSLEEAVAGATVAVAFRHPELSEEQALKIRDYAGQQIGKSYDYFGLVRQGGFQLDRAVFCSGKSGTDYERCVNWVGNVNLGKGGDDSFICSELVVAAFQSAGVPLTKTPPNWTSPNDLAQLGMARRLGYVGHLKAPPLSGTQSVALSLALPGNGRRTVINQTLATPFDFDATEWGSLISFRPPAGVQAAVKSRGVNWHVHRIEDAFGDINLDYYPVIVSTLPTVGGHVLGPDELLTYIRLNINSFVDSRIAAFSPYDEDEAKTWSSAAPLPSVVHIDMKAFGGWVNPDDGSVVCADYAPDHWTFSTIWTLMDMAHPVSGNRRFGYAPADGGGYVFYTRGADRATGVLDVAAMSIVFSTAHSLWLSLQKGIESFVTGNGGMATIGTATSIRTPWDAIKASHHRPLVGWI